MTTLINIRKFLVKFFVTGGFVGNINIMPGTLGSLLGVLAFYIYQNIEMKSNLDSKELELITLITISIVFFISMYLISLYQKLFILTNPDSREIVIDEILAQFLTLFLCNAKIFSLTKKFTFDDNIYGLLYTIMIPFALFRIFDILKPFPISFIDRNIKSPLGIMLDDVIAALFAFFLYRVTVNKIFINKIIDFINEIKL